MLLPCSLPGVSLPPDPIPLSQLGTQGALICCQALFCHSLPISYENHYLFNTGTQITQILPSYSLSYTRDLAQDTKLISTQSWGGSGSRGWL